MDIFLSTRPVFCRKTQQIQYSSFSGKNGFSVEEHTHAHTYKHKHTHTHTHTWPPWAVVRGQHGAKDMHILKVIDWEELTCRHSEEFSMQAWHAHPHICRDRKRAARQKSYWWFAGNRRETQPLTSCSHTGFVYAAWSNWQGQILWNIYDKRVP